MGLGLTLLLSTSFPLLFTFSIHSHSLPQLKYRYRSFALFSTLTPSYLLPFLLALSHYLLILFHSSLYLDINNFILFSLHSIPSCFIPFLSASFHFISFFSTLESNKPLILTFSHFVTIPFYSTPIIYRRKE